jgi:hypothetical protein
MSSPTFLSESTGPVATASLHDQVQIALAIADESALKSLLLNCTPPIAQPQFLGTVSSRIGIPIPDGRSVDGIIQAELVHCVLAESQDDIDRQFSITGDRDRRERCYAQLTRCESETQVLGQGISFAQALAMLTHAGFHRDQVQVILNLPHEACHKSWWYMLDAQGRFSLPFRRIIRTRRYSDGTLTVHYKDYFLQDQPPCFRGRHEQILVEVKSARHGFSKTLEKINRHRDSLGIRTAILISHVVGDLEAQGYISQGISLYAAHDIALPIRANCQHCAQRSCPMQGTHPSPVQVCQRFCLEGQVS